MVYFVGFLDKTRSGHVHFVSRSINGHWRKVEDSGGNLRWPGILCVKWK